MREFKNTDIYEKEIKVGQEVAVAYMVGSSSVEVVHGKVTRIKNKFIEIEVIRNHSYDNPKYKGVRKKFRCWDSVMILKQ